MGVETRAGFSREPRELPAGHADCNGPSSAGGAASSATATVCAMLFARRWPGERLRRSVEAGEVDVVVDGLDVAVCVSEEGAG